MLHGDMGQSLVMERPVAPMLWDTFGLRRTRGRCYGGGRHAGCRMGVVAAVWRGRWPDHAVSVFAYLGVSVPEFYLGLVLILVFGSVFHLLPTSAPATSATG